MSNTKDVTITATVPFDWTNELTADEAQCFFSWTSSPSTGLHLKYEDLGYWPNDLGGQTALYRLTIGGVEAVKPGALDTMMGALRRISPDARGSYVDLDDGYQRWDL